LAAVNLPIGQTAYQVEAVRRKAYPVPLNLTNTTGIAYMFAKIEDSLGGIIQIALRKPVVGSTDETDSETVEPSLQLLAATI
jgi:hypothetical protein